MLTNHVDLWLIGATPLERYNVAAATYRLQSEHRANLLAYAIVVALAGGR